MSSNDTDKQTSKPCATDAAAQGSHRVSCLCGWRGTVPTELTGNACPMCFTKFADITPTSTEAPFYRVVQRPDVGPGYVELITGQKADGVLVLTSPRDFAFTKEVEERGQSGCDQRPNVAVISSEQSWLSIQDNPPPKDGTPIIVEGGTVEWRRPYFGDETGGWFSHKAQRFLEWEPKVWMPLPLPPKDR